VTAGRLLSRLLPADPSDRHQFRLLLVWLELVGGVIGAAGLLAAVERGWIGVAGLVLGLLLLPAGLYLLALLAWTAIGLVSGGFARIVLASGEVPGAASFSAEEALVARGRIDDARAAYEARLHAAPTSQAIRFALAALHRDHRQDFQAAERLYLEIRAADPSGAREDSVSNALIDLYERTGNRGRLMAEYARLAARHGNRGPGAAAKRRLAELKQADPG
jgi:hypothetical protein